MHVIGNSVSQAMCYTSDAKPQCRLHGGALTFIQSKLLSVLDIHEEVTVGSQVVTRKERTQIPRGVLGIRITNLRHLALITNPRHLAQISNQKYPAGITNPRHLAQISNQKYPAGITNLRHPAQITNLCHIFTLVSPLCLPLSSSSSVWH